METGEGSTKPPVKQPDNRLRHIRHHEHEKALTEKQKAEAIAEKILGKQKDSRGENWTTELNWRGLYEVSIHFPVPYGTVVFVHENPTQSLEGEEFVYYNPKRAPVKVLHRVIFEPPYDPAGRIVSISSRDLRTQEDLPEDFPPLPPTN